ncbi:MAG: rhodanese-like domain-containing protein [Fusobacteriaceae bacterium]
MSLQMLDIKNKVTIFFLLAIIIGIPLGAILPEFMIDFLSSYFFSVLIGVLIWFVILGIMIRIDYRAITNITKNIEGQTVATTINWIIKPFTMYMFAVIFIKYFFKDYYAYNTVTDYVSGAILFGAAPCSFAIFLWSKKTHGKLAYTMCQFILNTFLIVLFFPFIVGYLFRSNEMVGYILLLFMYVVIFVLLTMLAGQLIKYYLKKKDKLENFNKNLFPKFLKLQSYVIPFCVFMVMIVQGQRIISQPFNILLLGIPFFVQTIIIFNGAYFWAKTWNIPHSIASPAAFIASSNFFQLAFAVAVLYPRLGLKSGAPLIILIAGIVEYITLSLLTILSNKTTKYFGVVKIHDFVKDAQVYYVIDVRTQQDFEKGHIPGAVNIPLATINDSLDRIPHRVKIVTYCNGGTSGGVAQSILEDEGYDVHNLKGGYNRYKSYITYAMSVAESHKDEFENENIQSSGELVIEPKQLDSKK